MAGIARALHKRKEADRDTGEKKASGRRFGSRVLEWLGQELAGPSITATKDRSGRMGPVNWVFGLHQRSRILNREVLSLDLPWEAFEPREPLEVNELSTGPSFVQEETSIWVHELGE
jgi:hypothetical protein